MHSPLLWSEMFDVSCVVSGEIEWPEGDEALPIDAMNLVLALLEQDSIARVGTLGKSTKCDM